MLSTAILLGPQRHVRTVREAARDVAPEGPIALVSAGWEDREPDDREFREHVQRPVVNLGVWARVERIFERDAELLAAMRERQDTLRRVQELYRARLSGAMAGARDVFRRHGGDQWLVAERDDAIAMLQELDRRHVERVADVHAQFEDRWRPAERPAVQREKRELARELESASCLCIAGGHLAALLHRLRLFDVLGLHGDRPVIAWSAGAMVLAERIVLFHDSPPQGSADPEVMEAGFAAVPGLVALPHARQRLTDTDDRSVQLFARRFAPAMCVLLDDGSRIAWHGSRWQAPEGTRRLDSDGWVAEVSA